MPMGSPMPSPTDSAMGSRPMPSPLVRGSSALATLPTARHMVMRLHLGRVSPNKRGSGKRDDETGWLKSGERAAGCSRQPLLPTAQWQAM